MNSRAVIPLLVYSDIEQAQAFLVNSFGFEAGPLERDPEGRVVHGEVSTGGQVIWLHRVTAEHRMVRPREDASSGLVVLVDDVDSHFERVHETGALIESEPRDQPYGQREYGVRDPEGHRWWFATRL